MGGHGFGALVGVLERQVAVGSLGLHDGHDLLRVHPEVGVPDALQRVQQLQRATLGRQACAVVDIMETLIGARVPLVDFDDDLVGDVQPGLGVSHGAAGDQQSVGQHGGHFDHSHIEVAVEAEPGLLGGVAQVGVDVFGGAGVDRLAQRRIGLEGKPLAQGARLGEHAVQLGRGGGTGPELDSELLTPLMGVLRPLGKGSGDGLGIPGSGEAAHADTVAVMDVGGCLRGRGDLAAQDGAGDARHGVGDASSSVWFPAAYQRM